MTLLALALVLSSAVVHASWNYLSKRVQGGAGFIWLMSCVTFVLYAPLALIVLMTNPFQISYLGWMMGSAILHIFYFILLNRGYRTGDMSLVYPLARGTGPMLSTLAAIFFLGERPTAIAVFGALLIGVGVVILTANPDKIKNVNARSALRYAFLTGLVIALYTLWDKQAVSAALIPPLLFDWGNNALRMLFLTPYALTHRDEVRHHIQSHRWETFGVALLSPLSYILVLTALTFSPVSYIAPAREISILIGTFMGTKLLAEGDSRRRLAAASVMLVGIVVLALAK
jgi:drug/metabolite transporter (DMT)-like permease